ncbi:Conserved_hypothetical protein [Hexamita inflata]|uniref:Uncharacterized protein n=1 Tax=Hexamita inflata TaxID=28002 RepID=A0AA86TTU7_9EUKA|nr:Conserved hypothetical protein [Hexamita inflata]CAI9963886.1 Conserved hypothetical protein [Hexamita inflata]
MTHLQRPNRHHHFASDGETYKQHVQNITLLNRRLFEIANQPVARAYTEFKHPNDMYLINADLYRQNRNEYLQRVYRTDRPYYDELSHIADKINEKRQLDKMTIQNTEPKLKNFFWTPVPKSNPLDYSKKLERRDLTQSERANLKQIEKSLQRPQSGLSQRPQSAQSMNSAPRSLNSSEKQQTSIQMIQSAQVQENKHNPNMLLTPEKKQKEQKVITSQTESTYNDDQIVKAREFVDRRPYKQNIVIQ